MRLITTGTGSKDTFNITGINSTSFISKSIFIRMATVITCGSKVYIDVDIFDAHTDQVFASKPYLLGFLIHTNYCHDMV
jgi:hypothetical protein